MKTLDDTEAEQIITTLPVLPRHQYPRFVRWFWGATLLLSMIYIPRFLIYNLPEHKETRMQLVKARQAFDQQDYKQAIDVCVDLIERYPDCKQARMILVKSSFSHASQS